MPYPLTISKAVCAKLTAEFKGEVPSRARSNLLERVLFNG